MLGDFAGKIPFRYRVFGLLLSEIIVLSFIRRPLSRDFDNWCFGDWGSNLTLNYLLKAGFTPGVDFGYHYGLLAALTCRVWFACFGATVRAYTAASLACGAAVAWAIADLVESLELGAPAIVLLVFVLPNAIPVEYFNFAHGIEAALLANALARQLRGRISSALCLAIIAVFVKPSLGYVYAVGLCLFAVYRYGPAGVRLLSPAAITGVALASVLSMIYGPPSLLKTISPLTGARAYKQLGFGHFGSAFWWRPDLGLVYYLVLPPAFWIAGSIWLLVCSYRHRHLERTGEILITCAIWQFVFTTTAFGGSLSWMYYFYILVIGVAATTTLYPRDIWARLCTPALLMFAFTANLGWVNTALNMRKNPFVPGSPGLTAPAAEVAEWYRINELTAGQTAMMISALGDPTLAFPGAFRPVGLFLEPGLTLDHEQWRIARQVSHADNVLLLIAGPGAPQLRRFPVIRKALAEKDKTLAGRYFEVFRKQQEPTPHANF